MINVGELITDSDFCTHFRIVHQEKVSNGPRFEIQEKIYEVTGIVDPVTPKEMQFLPEADRTKNLKNFRSSTKDPLFVNGTIRVSTICEYKGQRYKLIRLLEYDDFGYWEAVGQETGATPI